MTIDHFDDHWNRSEAPKSSKHKKPHGFLDHGPENEPKISNFKNKGAGPKISSSLDSSRWADHFSALICQNRMKNGEIMVILRLANVAAWPF